MGADFFEQEFKETLQNLQQIWVQIKYKLWGNSLHQLRQCLLICLYVIVFDYNGISDFMPWLLDSVLFVRNGGDKSLGDKTRDSFFENFITTKSLHVKTWAFLIKIT